MSLETLLEAAKYLEYRSQVKARGEEPHDYYTFSKISSINSDVASIAAQSSHQRHSLPSSASSSNSTEEPKERRRTISSTSRESLLSQDHGGSGTREVHNKLEKNRRAHLKECFEALKKQLPNMDERKTSNLSILRGALRFIQTLKRKEREHEHDLEKLARDKIAFQQQLSSLKKDLSSQYDHIDVNALITVDDNETTTTASEGGGSDFEDDYHNDVSSTSNPNSRLASDDTSSLSSSNAIGCLARSITTSTAPQQALAYSKQTSTCTVFPSGLKGTVVKNNTLFATENLSGATAKVLSRPSQLEPHIGHSVAAISDVINSHSSRVISTNNLQGMAGIIAPHTVQVITPPSSIKLLTAQTPAVVNSRQQGQIHVLTPSVSYVATPQIAASNGKASGESLMHSGEPHRGKQQSISPITLVSSQAFVGLTQAGTNSKPVIINQTSNFSEVMSPSSATQLMMKSSMFGSNMALTVKNNIHNSNSVGNISPNSQSLLNPSLHTKTLSPAQNVTNLISTEGGNLRQVTVSKAHSITSSTCNLLTHSNMAQLVSQSPITVPAGQIVAPGVTPLVGSVSVVSHTGALHPHQMLAQSQSLGKVLASPLLKSINQVNAIPIIQPQFLQAANSNQHIVKPVVVVSMPNIIHPNSISPLSQRTLISASDQCESPTSTIQK